MADVVGIELQLKENLQQRLKTILPLMEKLQQQTKNMEKMLSQTNGINKANRSLEMMANRLNAVSNASRGLNNVGHQFDNLGRHADHARQKVGLLHRAFGGVASGLGGMAGMMTAGLSIYTVGDMFKHGMDFEQQLKSLQIGGASPKQLASMRKTALQTANDPRFITTPTQQLEAMRTGRAVFGNFDEAEKMAPLAAQFNTAMRLINAPGGADRNNAEFAFKMAEQLGIRDTVRMKAFMNDLTKAEVGFAGKIDLAQLTQQFSTSRLAKYGSDILPFLTTQGHLLTEAGGGGRGAGRAGAQINALNRVLVQGTMTQATAQRFADLGLIGGYDAALAAKSSSKHPTGRHILHTTSRHDASGHLLSTSEDEIFITGKGRSSKTPTLTKGELGQLIVSGLKDRDLAIKNTPMWIYKDLIPALEKSQHKNFYKLDRNQQVAMLTPFLQGMQMNASDLIAQIALNKGTFDIQTKNVMGAPGMDEVTAQQRSMTQNLAKLSAAWTTFSTTLTTNDKVVQLVNNTFNTLTQLLLSLSKVIGPVADGVGRFYNVIDSVGSKVGTGAGIIGSTLTQAGQILFPENKDHRLATHTKSGSKDWAGDYRKNMLVPPPPPSMPSIAQMSLMDSAANGYPIQPFKMVPPPSPITVNVPVHLDSKQIAHATAKHHARAQAKSALGQNYATSRGSGGYSSPDYSAGAGQ